MVVLYVAKNEAPIVIVALGLKNAVPFDDLYREVEPVITDLSNVVAARWNCALYRFVIYIGNVEITVVGVPFDVPPLGALRIREATSRDRGFLETIDRALLEFRSGDYIRFFDRPA